MPTKQKKLKVAVMMDPIAGIDITCDSTFLLLLEAQARGHALCYYEPHAMQLENGCLSASGYELRVQNKKGAHADLGKRITFRLDDMDVILVRQDPPVDMRYLTTTWMLDRLKGGVLVVNDPTEIRNCPEKLLACDFADLMPPTLISSDLAAIDVFRKKHGDVVLKPLYACGGKDVFLLKKDDGNFDAVAEMLLSTYQLPLMAQRFIKEVSAGDKRIIMVDGKPAGAILRVPPKGKVRANFHAGGTEKKTILTARDKEICNRIGPVLKEKGLLFVGLDVIGSYLTEINVTSPTGLHQINRQNKVVLQAEIWDAIERNHAALLKKLKKQ